MGYAAYLSKVIMMNESTRNLIIEDTPLEKINDTVLEENNVVLFIKRDELNHRDISGNKWRKLKYNIAELKVKNIDTVLTFGGAYSNHIAATAAAGKEFGFKTIGVIRGRPNRIFNLFVDSNYHKKGVGRRLVEMFEKKAFAHKSKIIKISASLYAVPFYQRRGYKKTTGLRKLFGLKVQPM